KWIPGTHSASGPIQDVAGLRLETAEGKSITWRRDDLDIYRVEGDVPEGTREIVARLDTTFSGPAIQAAGDLSYRTELGGRINWSTCVLYPDGPASDDIRAHLGLKLPARWRLATALKVESPGGGKDGQASGDHLIKFKTVSLTELVDNPVIAGEY